MVNFTVDQVRATMDRQNHIRNATVIAHVDHGKSTLTDSLVRLAGISTTDRFTQGRDDEQERGITIKSTGLTLYFDLPEEDLPAGADGTGFLFNIIDSPGHVDFSSEVTAALRLTDGALVVVDCVEGVCVQTETVLRQALTERIKPVLIINKLDRMILELQQDPEEAYQTLLRVIESVNAIISTYSDQYSEDWMVSPENGTVAFGSGLHGWGFTVPRFARYLGKQLNKDPKAMQKRLWGDSFWDPETNKWTSSPVSDSGKKLRRGFCQFILDPVFKMVKSTNSGNKEVHDRLISRLGIELRGAEKEAQGRDLMKIVMPKWLPFGPVLLHMMTNHLPSPVVAQKYRTELLYTGPSDDVTSEAMRNCDREGPVLIFISKMVPANKGRFYAYGRVFSGLVKGGQTVRIMGPDYVPGETRDLYEKSIQRTCLAMGRYIENIDDVPCGNIVCLAGIDQYLVKSGTLSTREDSHPLRPMKFSVSPVVRRAIKPKNVADMKKLMSGLKKLSKSDPCVQCIIDESSGQVIVCGAGELHLEIVLKDLVELAGVEIVVEEPIVNYKETVTEVATDPCLAKSPNKHNRLWVTAEPMSMELCTAIAEKKVDPQGDPKVRGKIMTDEFGWDPTDTSKIWNFGPNGSGPNVLVDKTWGVQYMNEIKDHCRAAFENVCEKGILCGEELQGVRWNIKDATLHADSVHRGGAQMVPCTRRVLHAAQLAAKPTLLEPIYLAEITCPESASGGIYNVLARRRGHVVGVEHLRGGLILLRANLPVAESFGFSSALREATGGMAFPQCVFDHYQIVPGDPFESGSIAHTVVMKIRQRKGMPAELPKLADLVDKL